MAPRVLSYRPEARHDYAKSVRLWLNEERAGLKSAFFRRASPDQNLRTHAKIVDGIIGCIANDLALPRELAIAAVGGYGRGFLFPASDVDIVIVRQSSSIDTGASANTELNTAIEAFVSLLWDIGLEPGIAVRTVAECVEEAAKDVTVDTSLLETRHVWGDAALVHTLVDALNRKRTVADFFTAKIAEQRARHAKHNDVALNLEPNIKESPGGLRDLQTVLWLAKAANLGLDWDSLERGGILTAHETALMRRHRRVLIDLRIRLHYAANRREDRLVFDHQTTIAEGLRIAPTKSKLASEILMRRYYLSAKVIWQLNSVILPTLLARISDTQSDTRVAIDGEFDLHNGNIAARDDTVFQHDPRAIFRAFLALQRTPAAEFFEANTLRALWRAVSLIDHTFRRDEEANRLFLEVLRSERLTFALRRMSRYGVLGRFIPAFGRIVGQMQHDLFHVYTVDEHILMVVRNMRRLLLPRFAHEFPFCHELAREFARPEGLHLAALFHDIAKGRGGDHSVLGTQDARLFCRRLKLSRSDTELVAWLVQMHLQMSATAQKQDLSDPQVISRFAQLIPNERHLIALYLLTVADIRGTSPHVWNAWKGRLLMQLFVATQRLLRGDTQPNTDWLNHKKHQALLHYRKVPRQSDATEPPLWAYASQSYFQRFDVEELLWHAVALDADVSPKSAFVRVRAPSDDAIEVGYAVMVMTHDKPGIFARITGYFEKLGFDIAAAKISTTTHGYALDAFHVLPKSGATARYRDIAGTVEHDLARVLDAPEVPPTASKGRLARQVKHFPIAPAVNLTTVSGSTHWELSITCADRPGLLSAIARVLFQLDVNLLDARVTTLGQRAEDIFVVSGSKLGDASFRDALCAELVTRVQG